MTLNELKEFLGINGITKISEVNRIVIGKNGHTYPASSLEEKMWKLLKGLCADAKK